MNTLRKILEDNFSLILLASVAVGVLVPGLEESPPVLVSLCLASIIFLSGFQITWEELSQIPLRTSARLYLIRFLCLPIVMFFGARLLFPSYDTSVLLFTLMPTGVAAPAVALLIGGNVSVALGLLVLSSLLSPLTVPLLFYYLQGASVSYDYGGMFVTLLLIVVAPIVLHIPFRRSPFARQFAKTNAKSLSTLLVAAIMVLVVGSSREALFSDLSLFGESLFLTTSLFALFYLVGWLVSSPLPLPERLAITVSSGVNNNALGIGIAAIHFSPAVALFFVISELPWIIAIAVIGRIAKKFEKAQSGFLSKA